MLAFDLKLSFLTELGPGTAIFRSNLRRQLRTYVRMWNIWYARALEVTQCRRRDT